LNRTTRENQPVMDASVPTANVTPAKKTATVQDRFQSELQKQVVAEAFDVTASRKSWFWLAFLVLIGVGVGVGVAVGSSNDKEEDRMIKRKIDRFLAMLRMLLPQCACKCSHVASAI
jgi:hypothetical protein